jgi:hypothetical protein
LNEFDKKVKKEIKALTSPYISLTSQEKERILHYSRNKKRQLPILQGAAMLAAFSLFFLLSYPIFFNNQPVQHSSLNPFLRENAPTEKELLPIAADEEDLEQEKITTDDSDKAEPSEMESTNPPASDQTEEIAADTQENPEDETVKEAHMESTSPFYVTNGILYTKPTKSAENGGISLEMSGERVREILGQPVDIQADEMGPGDTILTYDSDFAYGLFVFMEKEKVVMAVSSFTEQPFTEELLRSLHDPKIVKRIIGDNDHTSYTFYTSKQTIIYTFTEGLHHMKFFNYNESLVEEAFQNEELTIDEAVAEILSLGR